MNIMNQNQAGLIIGYAGNIVCFVLMFKSSSFSCFHKTINCELDRLCTIKQMKWLGFYDVDIN